MPSELFATAPAPYRAERAISSAPDAATTWVVVDRDFELHLESVAYLSSLRARDCSLNTERVYAGRIALYLSYCAEHGVDWTAPTLMQLAAFLRWLVEEPRAMRGGTAQAEPSYRSKSTANAIMTAVCEFLRFSELRGWVAPTVVMRLSKPKFLQYLPKGFNPGERGQFRTVRASAIKFRVPEPGFEYLTAAQLRRLLELAQRPRHRFLVALMAGTGMRIGEALGLRREDMHLLSSSQMLGCQEHGPHVHVRRRRNANGALAKSRFPRAIPVEEEAVGLYADYAFERDQLVDPAEAAMVFVNLYQAPVGEGMSYANAKQLFDRLSRRAGFVVRPHMLRHTAATHWIRAGVGRDTVQALLGHASSRSMERYLHASDQDKRAAVEEVARRRREQS